MSDQLTKMWEAFGRIEAIVTAGLDDGFDPVRMEREIGAELAVIRKALPAMSEGIDQDVFGTVCHERDVAQAEVRRLGALLASALEALVDEFGGTYASCLAALSREPAADEKALAAVKEAASG